MLLQVKQHDTEKVIRPLITGRMIYGLKRGVKPSSPVLLVISEGHDENSIVYDEGAESGSLASGKTALCLYTADAAISGLCITVKQSALSK